ncbi:MAG: hypothetical protein ACOYOK_12830 [Pseudobdellovibrionaceae bacterium]
MKEKYTFFFMQILSIFYFLFNSGCQLKSEHIIEYTPVNKGTPGAEVLQSPSNEDGGYHSGGGHGVDGKPLEFYRQSLFSKVEFGPIKDLILLLHQQAPGFAAALQHIADERSWYFIPIELNKIPEPVIGNGFQLEQLALHKRKEIWISAPFYNLMTAAQKQDLLIHELVMGVFLLQYQDKLDQCLSQTAAYSILNELDQKKLARKKCYSNYGLNLTDRGQTLTLTDDNYTSIRFLSHQLLHQYTQINFEEFPMWLKVHGFIIQEPE